MSLHHVAPSKSNCAEELARRELVYLHVLEALPGHFLHAEGEPQVLPSVREKFPGTLIANSGYQLENGNALLAGNGADAIAFGTLFLANLDLVERFSTEGQSLMFRT